MKYVEKLTNHYNYSEFKDIDFNLIFSTAKIISLEKHQIWIHQGEPIKHFSVVIEGLLRLYYVNLEGKEFTKNFAVEGNVCGILSALLQKKPAGMNIEALTDTKLLIFDFSIITLLAECDFGWSRVLNQIMIHSYLEKENRESELLYYDAFTRYKNFMEKFPKWNQIIPRKYIASYLGMSAETLSRITNRVD